MRWISWLLATMVVGACAAPIGSQNIPIASAPLRPTEPPPIRAAHPAAAFNGQPSFHADLPDLGETPELQNAVWLNTDRPLRLAGLHGKVILLEMWTFGCINCRNVIPTLRGWHAKYAEQGLVVIGNHFPEFDYERDLNNLKDALQRLNVPYAVAQDNEGRTWQAYRARYWPSLFLIDKRGRMRYTHIGEGAYGETEQAIQDLLRETYQGED